MRHDARDFELGTCAACGTVAIRADQGWWAHRDSPACSLRRAGSERAHFVPDDEQAAA